MGGRSEDGHRGESRHQWRGYHGAKGGAVPRGPRARGGALDYFPFEGPREQAISENKKRIADVFCRNSVTFSAHHFFFYVKLGIVEQKNRVVAGRLVNVKHRQYFV